MGVAVPTIELPTHDLDALRRLAHPDEALTADGERWRRANYDRYMESFEPIEHALKREGPKALVMFGSLYLHRISEDGEVIDLGLAGHHKITTVGCERLVACMNGSDTATLVNFKYHGIGLGTTAEANGDTALGSELDNELIVLNTRATGSQGVGANNHVYRTSATCQLGVVGSPQSVTEHGVFSAATTGTGYLLDRTVFAAIVLNSNEGVNAQYDMTAAPGG